MRRFQLLKLLVKQVKRLPINTMIRNLVSWQSETSVSDGYTVVIACMKDLAPVAVANLRLCAASHDSRMREIILVFDCPVEQIPQLVKDTRNQCSGSALISLVGYNKRQYSVAKRIHWGWVYSWLSWCLAIRHVQTRAVIIHDLDAIPLSEDLFRKIYDNWLAAGAEFCGIRRYEGNGVCGEMELVATFELAIDTEYIRSTYSPYDLFNKLRVVDNRIVDFDTMLFAQWCSPRRALREIDESQLVHPSQLICQYTEFVAGRTIFRKRRHALPVLLYFMYLGGDPEPMLAATAYLRCVTSTQIPAFGRQVCIDGITPEGWAWMEKQIRRVEQYVYGATRAEVTSYLQGMMERSGESRTVGRESGEFAVSER